MKKYRLGDFFPTNISKKQASDSGMAVVLILLLIGLFTQDILYLKLAIPFLVMNMVFPMFFYAFAILWLGFSHLLGTVVSKILLSVVFLVMVVPVGIVRRLLGKDALQLAKFHKGEGSVMVTRNKRFDLKDIEKPY